MASGRHLWYINSLGWPWGKGGRPSFVIDSLVKSMYCSNCTCRVPPDYEPVCAMWCSSEGYWKWHPISVGSTNICSELLAGLKFLELKCGFFPFLSTWGRMKCPRKIFRMGEWWMLRVWNPSRSNLGVQGCHTEDHCGHPGGCGTHYCDTAAKILFPLFTGFGSWQLPKTQVLMYV